MAKKFQTLLAEMHPERRVRMVAQIQQLLEEMPLQDLRQALDLTQQQVAASLSLNQIALSKVESQTDLYSKTK